MNMETFEKLDLVHLQGRICTVIEVESKEPKYKIQIGPDARNIRRVETKELVLVQKYTSRKTGSNLVLETA